MDAYIPTCCGFAFGDDFSDALDRAKESVLARTDELIYFRTLGGFQEHKYLLLKDIHMMLDLAKPNEVWTWDSIKYFDCKRILDEVPILYVPPESLQDQSFSQNPPPLVCYGREIGQILKNGRDANLNMTKRASYISPFSINRFTWNSSAEMFVSLLVDVSVQLALWRLYIADGQRGVDTSMGDIVPTADHGEEEGRQGDGRASGFPGNGRARNANGHGVQDGAAPRNLESAFGVTRFSAAFESGTSIGDGEPLALGARDTMVPIAEGEEEEHMEF